MSAQNVLLPSFLPGPSILLELLDKDHPFEHAWKARAHTSPAIISWLYAWRGRAILREVADRLFKVFLPPWMQSSELCLICVATRSIHLDEVCRLFGFINRSRARRYLHNRVLDCQQYRVWCRFMDVQCGDYHSVLWTIITHTLCVCVERGYIGPSTVPGSWEWGWKFFRFF